MAKIEFGLMMRGQYPQGESMAEKFGEICAQARLAEKLGFWCIVKGSHYAGAPLQDLQQIPFLARIMAEAPNVRLVAGIVLLSLHKPLQIAEELASLDVMSNGKVIFGAALGYRDVEFKGFGTTQKERVPRFEENLEAIKRLWTEDNVNMVGSHFTLEDVTLSNKPVQEPRPPIWIGANVKPAIKRAARLGDCWYINPHNRLDTIMEQMDVYRQALDEAGKPFPTQLPMRREIFVARTRKEALKLCGPSLEAKYQAYHQWGQDKAMPEGDNDLGQEFSDLLKDRFLIGSPEEVAENIINLAGPIGVTHLIGSLHWPGMENKVAMDAMQMFMEECAPKVRQGL
jgi:alkanesulfonate monooxygenase SsuD/methylene tetrahydromethanopterin reductase-like flavin-dependent oxidoreductase (luciferase family)